MISVGIVNYMEPLPFEGEKQWRAHQICHIVGELGYKSTYFTSSFDHFKKSFRKKSSLKLIDSTYSIQLCNATSYKKNRTIARIISNICFSISLFLKAIRSKNKVWIVSYPHSYSIIAILLVKILRKNISIIVDVRDSPFTSLKSLKGIAYNFFERILIEIWIYKIDHFIGLGENINLNFPDKKSKLIKSNYTYIPMSLKPIDYNKYQLERSNDLVFLGNLTQSFDTIEMIDNFLAIESKCLLHIIGSGPQLEGLKEKYIKSKKVIFHGFLKQKEYIPILLRCSYGLLPYSSKDYRFKYHITNKYPEYLNAGLTPIVPQWCYEMATFSKQNKVGILYRDYNELKSIFEKISTRKLSSNHEQTKGIFDHHFSYNEVKKRLIELLSRNEYL